MPVKHQSASRRPKAAAKTHNLWLKVIFTLAAVGLLAWLLVAMLAIPHSRVGTDVGQPSTNTAPSNPTTSTNVMEVAKAVMVTVELDFGSSVPSIAEAVRDHIERRHAPEDGKGRTFAILDAYGQPTAEGKLHISMHVSSEKPGAGALVFKRTGEVLWQSRIVPATNPPAFSGQELTILLDDGTGKTVMVDGSRNPASILDASIRGKPSLVRDFWPDGAERELTYIYSACGCPVKVMVRREGERTFRTKDMPVIFPDDPAVVRVIHRLMGWPS